MHEDPSYEYVVLSVRDGMLTPDSPAVVPEDPLSTQIGQLVSDGWELDPSWQPADPGLTLRRHLGLTPRNS